MKKFFLLFISVLPLLAQEPAGIRGKVLDAATNQPLVGANVYLEGLARGSATNASGLFEIANLPAGEYTIVASFLGYGKHRKEVKIVEGEQLEINFALKPIVLPAQSVVVTALLASERESPVVFSSLDHQQIKDLYTTQDVPILLSELPSTIAYSWSGNGIGYNFLKLRGFEQRRLSVMVNGVPQNDPDDHGVYWLDMPDLLASAGTIQVQRGAGSAFYGPPAIGGSINILTSNFSLDPRISLYAGHGSYNTQRYSLAINSGLVEGRYSLYGRLSSIATSGYRDNSWARFSSYFLTAVRYGEQTTMQINLFGGPFEDHLVYRGIPKDAVKDKAQRRISHNYMGEATRDEEIENFSQPHYQILHEWRVSENLVVNNTLFYIRGTGFWDMDASWGDTTYFRLSSPYARRYGFQTPTANPTRAIAKYFIDLRQYGWLPRASWKHSDGELTVGGELRIHRGIHWGSIEWAQLLPAQLPADYRFYEYWATKDIASVYVHELFRPAKAIRLMASLQAVYNRYKFFDEKPFYESGQWKSHEFSVPYYFLNPKVGVSYDITPLLNLYGSFSITSREPSRRDLYDASDSPSGKRPNFAVKPNELLDFSKPLIKPERLFDLEVGGRYYVDQFRGEVNFYYMDFRDELVKSGQLNLFGDPIVGNAEKTRHMGLELTATVQNFFVQGLEVTGHATLTRNRIIRNDVYIKRNPYTGERYPQQTKLALDGKTIAGFPDYMGSIRATYRNGGLLVSLLGKYVGDHYTDNFNLPTRKVDAYKVIDLTVAHRWSHIFGIKLLEFRLQVNNIFDELYAASGVGDDFFPAAERNYFLNIAFDL